MSVWARVLCDAARQKLETDLSQIARCAGLLSNAELWSRANEHCNSVGNLILHLEGNVRQWILGGIGGEAVSRDRPAEFGQRQPLPSEPIVRRLQGTVAKACERIAGLDETRLLAEYEIQAYRMSGLVAVFHVAEHFSFHTGQIVHMSKAIKDVDLSLYDAQGKRLGGDGRRSPW